jgi:hypothetical protein
MMHLPRQFYFRAAGIRYFPDAATGSRHLGRPPIVFTQKYRRGIRHSGHATGA